MVARAEALASTIGSNAPIAVQTLVQSLRAEKVKDLILLVRYKCISNHTMMPGECSSLGWTRVFFGKRMHKQQRMLHRCTRFSVSVNIVRRHVETVYQDFLIGLEAIKSKEVPQFSGWE